MENRTLFQVAYLVNDLQASMQRWSDVHGAGPFSVSPHHRTDRFTYRGTDHEADVSYAFGYLGDLMIQFIVQHDEAPSIYRDMYAAGEEGFHHQAYLVHDFEAEHQRVAGMGYEPACRLYADGVDAAYFDTRELNGGFTEIHGDPQHILATFARWRRAHTLYTPGVDPLVIPRVPPLAR